MRHKLNMSEMPKKEKLNFLLVITWKRKALSARVFATKTSTWVIKINSKLSNTLDRLDFHLVRCSTSWTFV